ncbi:unnamed protein product [Prorocentrum cordatum]|uniref:Uncharacterized protein n=1 Tax=Prorocentrum cordatum TaxID=2364126 RepID=A0ABN9VMZ7_9DINO|nr:unnamed protein product [Polarella glacialis]
MPENVLRISGEGAEIPMHRHPTGHRSVDLTQLPPEKFKIDQSVADQLLGPIFWGRQRNSDQANATAEDKPKETTAPKTEVHSSGTAAGETPSAGASGGNRFEKSVQQSGQIKAAVGKVKDKVELTRQAAVKVKQGFEDYKGKVVEMKNQLAEVDKQQHEYHEKLLGHFDGEESDRMSAFDNAPSLESEGSSNATAAASGLLQAHERLQPSKEHVKVSAGGSLHAARH